MKYLIWDFDGTLGYRTGSWSSVLADIVRREFPEHSVEAEDLRPYLKSGFPWHTPERPSPPNRPATEWWESLFPVFERALHGAAGLGSADAKRLARLMRHGYTDTAQWRLYDDTLPTLSALSERGWKHVILSNHVPELPTIVEALGLTSHIGEIFNSAVIGLEKPNPGAFHAVLATLGDAKDVWMIGDNPIADVAGAEAVGLSAILVRSRNSRVRYYAETLTELIDLVYLH